MATGGGWRGYLTGWGLFWSHRIPREPSALIKKKKKGGLEDKLRTKEFVCAKTAEGGA